MNRNNQQGGGPKKVRAIILSVVFGLAGLGMFMTSLEERPKLKIGEAEPIYLNDLTKPEKNQPVNLIEVIPHWDHSFYSYDEDAGSSNIYAFVPLVNHRAADAPIKYFLKLKKATYTGVKGDRTLTDVTGLIKPVSSLSKQDKESFSKRYPGEHADEYWIIQYELPGDNAYVNTMMIMGGLILAVCTYFFVRAIGIGG